MLLQRSQNSFANVMTTRLAAADEELDLLWWAFSDYSELANTRWADLAPATAAVLCGIELGNKLVFEIELPSTEALLARLLGRTLEEPWYWPRLSKVPLLLSPRWYQRTVIRCYQSCQAYLSIES